MPTLLVIVGSTRPGRAGLPVAQWFHKKACSHGGFDVAIADLAELRLPLLNEPHHPRLAQYTHCHTRNWSETVARSDAFVIVTPEYNCGYPAALKNAIDYLHREWRHKPVGFVSYGGVAGGTRAVQQLKQVVTTLDMFPLFASVSIPFFLRFLTDGHLRADDVMEDAATAMLDELGRVEAALRPLRAPAG